MILIEREGKDHQMWTTGQNSFKKLMLINSFVNISKRSKFFSFFFRVISRSSFDEVILSIFPKYCVYLPFIFLYFLFYIYFPFSFVCLFNSFVLPFYLYSICLSVVSIIATCFVRREMQLSNRSRMTIN